MCIILHKLFATGYLLETHLHDGPLNLIGPHLHDGPFNTIGRWRIKGKRELFLAYDF